MFIDNYKHDMFVKRKLSHKRQMFIYKFGELISMHAVYVSQISFVLDHW
jgi:hypothetical protein